MPDCSYFLQGDPFQCHCTVVYYLLQLIACLHVFLASLAGLCTNTACPYRHVKVNSNAPVCEDFLKGYCADGDEVFMISLELYDL